LNFIFHTATAAVAVVRSEEGREGGRRERWWEGGIDGVRGGKMERGERKRGREEGGRV